MTIQELNAIEKRVNATPEGPWDCKVGVWYDSDGVKMPIILGSDLEPAITKIDSDFVCVDEISEFIARARTDVPALIAEVRRLQAQINGDNLCSCGHPARNHKHYNPDQYCDNDRCDCVWC